MPGWGTEILEARYVAKKKKILPALKCGEVSGFRAGQRKLEVGAPKDHRGV